MDLTEDVIKSVNPKENVYMHTHTILPITLGPFHGPSNN